MLTTYTRKLNPNSSNQLLHERASCWKDVPPTAAKNKKKPCMIYVHHIRHILLQSVECDKYQCVQRNQFVKISFFKNYPSQWLLRLFYPYSDLASEYWLEGKILLMLWTSKWSILLPTLNVLEFNIKYS